MNTDTNSYHTHMLQVTTMSLSNKTLMAVVMTRTVKPLSDEELGSSRFSQLSQPDDLFSWNSVITEGLFPKFREMKSEMMLILEATRPLSETISLPSNLLSDQLVIELVSVLYFDSNKLNLLELCS